MRRRRLGSAALAVTLAGSLGLTGTASAATTRTCQLSDVHVHLLGAGVGAGNWADILTLTNVSRTPCTSSGYLTVHLLKTHDQRLARAPRERAGYMGGYLKPGRLPLVTLRPGESASALLQGSSAYCNDNPCPLAWGISIRLPGQAGFVRMRIVVQNSPTIGITPLVPGLTGSSS